MANRKGDWIQTYTGKRVWPLDPLLEEIDIVDIAWALSNQCRYNGHTSRFYSVAEHSIWVSRYCPLHLCLEGLMHDSPEAYLPDVSSPLKPFLNGFKKIEEDLLRVIFKKFDLVYPVSVEIKRIDTAILKDEQKQLMAPPFEQWHHTTEPALGICEEFGMYPELAFFVFLNQFAALKELRNE